jgi:DNA-binding NarL/FixJ family response regulator
MEAAILYTRTVALLAPRHPEGASQKAPQILAIVPQGSNRLLLHAISQETGWNLMLSETLPSPTSGWQTAAPPIIIYDRELAAECWREIVRVLTKKSPKPYVILLSANTDANLWDELQRVGGSDILRAPVTRDSMLRALKRARQFWHCQKQVRSPNHKRL